MTTKKTTRRKASQVSETATNRSALDASSCTNLKSWRRAPKHLDLLQKEFAALAKVLDRSDPNTTITDEDTDDAYRAVKSAPPFMSKKDMENMEEAISSDPGGVARRTSLAVLTMSGGELMRKIEQDRDTAIAFAAAEEMLRDYGDKLEVLRQLVDRARGRIFISLACREDMIEVMDKGSKSLVYRVRTSTSNSTEVQHA